MKNFTIRHLPFIISSSNLILTDHAKERRLQRSIALPKLSKWSMIKQELDYKSNGFVQHLSWVSPKGEPVRMVVKRVEDGKFLVVTVMWDYEYTEGVKQNHKTVI